MKLIRKSLKNITDTQEGKTIGAQHIGNSSAEPQITKLIDSKSLPHFGNMYQRTVDT